MSNFEYRECKIHAGEQIPPWVPDEDGDPLVFFKTISDGSGSLGIYVYDFDQAAWTRTVDRATELSWPVGSIFISVVATDPSVLLGFGTWESFASGRMLVGLDSGDGDFDTLEEEGGEKEHVLTIPEMPAHTHSFASFDTTNNTADISGTSDRAISGTTGSTGGGGAHENMPPYVVVLMWKRTA